MAKKFLTLDIGAANIALAEYEVAAKGAPTLVNYGTARLAAPIDSGDAGTILAPAILEIVREKGIKPGPVAISVSGQMVFPRFAAITPAGGDEKFAQMIRYEIEQNVPFPIDEMICSHQVLGDTPSGDRNVMIVAAKTEQIEAITDAVSSTGFRPEIVDVAPVALTNAVRATTGDGGCVVILDIGAKTTSLVIAEGENIYNRSIPIAGNNVTRDIAQALGCSTDEAEQLKIEHGYVSLGGVAEDEDEVTDRVAKVCRAVMTRLQAEISRSVNFYRSQQGGSAPTKLYLTGGTALLPQIDQFFAEALQLEVEFFNMFDYIGVGPALDAEAIGADGAFLAPTAGLALHFADAAHFAINLLPPSILADRAEKAKIPVVATAGVVLLAALAMIMVAFNREGAALRAAAETADAKLSQLRNFEKKVKAGEESVEKAKAEAETMRKLLASRTDAVARFNAVRSALVPGMWIEKWEDGRITVRGWKDRIAEYIRNSVAKDGAKAPTASELVAERLKGFAAVDASSVRIADMSDVGRNAPVTQFTVELKFK